jgi:hypothetical protein
MGILISLLVVAIAVGLAVKYDYTSGASTALNYH